MDDVSGRDIRERAHGELVTARGARRNHASGGTCRKNINVDARRQSFSVLAIGKVRRHASLLSV